MLKRPFILLLSIFVLGVGAVVADWWTAMPTESHPGYKPATYVGRNTCAECHSTQHADWSGSHHDLAMDHATQASVLGDFDDAELEHYGVTSRMFRRDDKYFIHTEGPDGKMADFEVKYVFGVEPLQQYMIELERDPGLPKNQVGKVQVLRVSWDTEKKEWFYLSPPDVDDKLAADDPMHWTGMAQNWNHMCASCHSTGYQKNFDVATQNYHSSFSEIDVSCETCHGPASKHVELATANSLFWDRNIGYGLKQLKGDDSTPQIESCAPCHSRRRTVYPDTPAGQDYYDCFVNELLTPETYYCDGQILDEVYVYGSFLQSKMYHKGIRCTDCHDPHTTKLKLDGNAMCVSCHDAHPAGKYDTPNHHHHQQGSAGAQCVNCHMPASPYMELDFRRDHSLRIPRPDLSVDLKTPNACTGCHLEQKNIDADKHEGLPHYAAWMAAAKAGDTQVSTELERVDRWAADLCDQWYPDKYGKKDHFAYTLSQAWAGDPSCIPELRDLARLRKYPSIIRASALMQLAQLSPEIAIKLSQKLVSENDPQIQTTAVMVLEGAELRDRLDGVSPLLDHPVRSIRVEAARVLADVGQGGLPAEKMALRDAALQEYKQGVADNGDLAMAHSGLAILAERQQNLGQAIDHYKTAIRVQPGVRGPRSNLAATYEAIAKRMPGTSQAAKADAEIQRLRAEELELYRRDIKLLPDSALLQYQYGLALYLAGEYLEAKAALERAVELDPKSPQYAQGLQGILQFLNSQPRPN